MADNSNQNMIGRPPLTPEQKNEIVQKLEPYLKSGMTLRKACYEANIPKSTVYDLKEKDIEFSDKIERFQQHISILVSNTTYLLVVKIHSKVEKGEELTKQEYGFIKWFALNSKCTKEEFGNRMEVEVIDPEKQLREVKKIIESYVGPRILPDPPTISTN